MATCVSRRILAVAGVLVFLSASAALADSPDDSRRPEPEVYGDFQGDPMYTLLPPDGIPAILDPEYVTGEAAAAQMSPAETVLGLATSGDAVCWSTWQLDHHEIVNDVFEGTAIAATW